MPTFYNQPGKEYNDSTTTYNGLVLGSHPKTRYSVVIAQVDSSNNWAVGDVVCFVDNPTNLAWTEYVNLPGEAFFTLRQDDPKSAQIASAIKTRPHMLVYRNGELVWAGWLGQSDETYDDVIFYGYSYLSGLYDLLTVWDVTYTNANISTIMLALWQRANSGITNSRMAWMSTGTVEDAWTDNNQNTILTMPYYPMSYKRIITAMAELAAFAISDTSNHVIFEIDPKGRFNFYADHGSVRNDVRWSLGNGMVRDFKRLRTPMDTRNDLFVVGISPTDVTLNDEVSNSTSKTEMGVSQEPIFLQSVRDSTELTRVGNLRLNRAVRVDSDLFLSFFRDVVTPYRATGADYSIGDTVTVNLNRGASAISNETKVVVGQQVIYYRKSENVRVLLADNF